MHPQIEERIKEYHFWAEEIKKLDKVCYKMDEIKQELEKVNEFSSMFYYTYIYTLSVYVYIEHPKYISGVLKIFHKHLGKIKYRDIKTSEKKFNFKFDNVDLDIRLIGDSCKLVKIGEKSIDVFELKCSNGKEAVIDEKEMEKLGVK